MRCSAKSTCENRSHKSIPNIILNCDLNGFHCFAFAPQELVHVITNTKQFEIVCKLLEQQVFCENATCHFDGMSGGFKFSDEIPGLPSGFHEEFFHAYTGTLRSLWAYRISVVLGKTRTEFEAIWLRTKKLAPHWPGFRTERIDVFMLPFARKCVKNSAQLADDLDRLNEAFSSGDL